MQKKYSVKFYDSTGTLIKTVSPELMISDIEFDAQLNGGLGTLRLDFALSFDDFNNEVTYADVYNFVKVYEFDPLNLTGKLIFTGVVSEIAPVLEKDGSERVSATCNGISSLFENLMLNVGGSYEPAYVSVDPSAIVTDILDQAISEIGVLYVQYDSTVGSPTQSIFSVGTNVTITFGAGTTLFSAMEKCVELAGDGWNWFIDQFGIVYFIQKPATPTHYFQISKSVNEIQQTQDTTDLVNSVVIVYDGGTLVDDDPASIALYGKRDSYINDKSIKDATTAQQAAENIMKTSVPIKRTTIKVNTKYIFEDIFVGDTCSVRGLISGSVTMDSNALIVGLNYSPEEIEITLGEFISLATEVRKVADFSAKTIVTGGLPIITQHAKITPEGGLAIRVTNKTGGASVKGTIVCTSDTTPNAVKKVIDGRPDAIGAVYDNGIADGAEMWVIVSGIADVYYIGATTMGNLARTFVSGEGGYVTGQATNEPFPTSPFATDKHFCEIGHVLETRATAGLAKTILHFN